MPKKKKLTPLQEAFKKIDTIAKNAKVSMTFHRENRTYGFLAHAFGLKIYDPDFKTKVIKNINAEVDLYVNGLKTIKRIQYECARYLNERGEGLPEESKEAPKGIGERDRVQDESSGTNQTLQSLAPLDVGSSGGDQGQRRDGKGDEEDSGWNESFPDASATLLTQRSHGCDQKGVAKAIFTDIYKNKMKGQLLCAMAGSGKTYIAGNIIKNLINKGFFLDCLSPWPILYLTKSSVVGQTKKVLSEEFNLDVWGLITVTNVEALRSQALKGSLIVPETAIDGDIVYNSFKWQFPPKLIIFDECQYFARQQSLQTEIGLSFFRNKPEVPWETYFLFISATPGSRVSEFKMFALSTGKEIDTGISKKILEYQDWPAYSRAIASPGIPEDYNTAAVKRLMDDLSPYIKRISNIRPKHRSYNTVSKITLSTREEYEEYHSALERHNKRKAAIEADDTLTEAQQRFALLAEFTIFRKAAENCRRYHLARFCHETWQAGYAPAVAFAFKQTGTNIIKILIEDYNWKRDDISIIWGGSTESLSMKAKLGKKIKENKDLQEFLEGIDLDIEGDLGIFLNEIKTKTDEQLKFEKDNNLLTQKPEDRERERMRFQKQLSKACLFSYKSGGVGLSLHHEAKYKNARPRQGIFTPVYSEKELVQALYRLPRITSASDTSQSMCYYVGTIEVHVAERVKMKLKCLKEVTRGSKESWEDIITEHPILTTDRDEQIMDAVDDFEGGHLLMDYKEEQ